MNAVYPVSLEKSKDGRGLQIGWSDGQIRRYFVAELRRECPCASCREKARAAAEKPPELLPVIANPQGEPLTIVQMEPLGQYAYTIIFSDGHNTGIYTFDFLRQAGEAAAEA